MKKMLGQAKKQHKALDRAGKIAADAKAKVLLILHDSDLGKSATAKIEMVRKEAKKVTKQWRAAAKTLKEKALRAKIGIVPTTRDRITKAGNAIVESITKNDKLAKVGVKSLKAGKHFAAAIPFAGALLVQSSAAHAASEGDYTTAALDEAGMVPVAGDLLDAFRGGLALGEVANEILPLEEAAMKAGDATEKAAKYLGASDDTARIIGGIGAAAGAIHEFAMWTNPVTGPYKLAAALF